MVCGWKCRRQKTTCFPSILWGPGVGTQVTMLDNKHTVLRQNFSPGEPQHLLLRPSSDCTRPACYTG